MLVIAPFDIFISGIDQERGIVTQLAELFKADLHLLQDEGGVLFR